jgi:hypothetical protein
MKAPSAKYVNFIVQCMFPTANPNMVWYWRFAILFVFETGPSFSDKYVFKLESYILLRQISAFRVGKLNGYKEHRRERDEMCSPCQLPSAGRVFLLFLKQNHPSVK